MSLIIICLVVAFIVFLLSLKAYSLYLNYRYLSVNFSLNSSKDQVRKEADKTILSLDLEDSKLYLFEEDCVHLGDCQARLLNACYCHRIRQRLTERPSN